MWVCKKCGGANIAIRMWVDPNTNTPLDICSDGDTEDNWCSDCSDSVEFIEKYD